MTVVDIANSPTYGIHAFGNVFATPKSNLDFILVSGNWIHNCWVSKSLVKKSFPTPDTHPVILG
ncbi:hypothetical protein [Nostoc sp.]|uniref:hypothetical protein n=1 Tax=Nostoc sp. TaxID=1180 RepID=UPI002FF70EC0